MNKSVKILIAEDEKILANDMQRSLENVGYTVTGIVFSGKQVLRRVKETQPDLVLIDIILRGEMDGIEVADQIRSRFNIPVVYVTAYADEKTIEKVKRTEPFGYILKPFGDYELRGAIEMALYKHKVESRLKESEEQLRNLAAHLQSAREEERTNVAREIHDELGQALTVLKMDVSWLKNRLGKDQKKLLSKAKSMEKLIDSTIQSMKRISTGLRPGLLDDLGLSAAIEWQAEEFQERTGIKCKVVVDPEDIVLDQDRSTAIFRIFQEALTNVARHAKATKVHVRLRCEEDRLKLVVRDNGKGITEEQISNPKSFGLIGIRERATSIQGDVEIRAFQNRGTAVTATIPLL